MFVVGHSSLGEVLAVIAKVPKIGHWWVDIEDR